MKIFGSIGHVKKLGHDVRKLSDRSAKMVFIGYEEGTKGYRLLDPVSRTLHVSKDVIFEEDQVWVWSTLSDQHQPDQFIVEYHVTVSDPTTGSAELILVPGSLATFSSPHFHA
jgi:hypothetical protein